jgi:N-acetyl-anhydromuramoyl-L-alanine amidase
MLRKQSLHQATSTLHINEAGWCEQATILPSPNFAERAQLQEISLLVIHNISLPAGSFGGNYIAQLFQNQLDCNAHPSFESLRDLRVSSHFLILRDGALLQFVASINCAWHAGVSSFQGRDACNQFSIGIELEGCDDQAFTDAQYRSLFQLTNALVKRHPLQHIVGHEEIAPGRKTDPGPYFDWLRYRLLLKGWERVESVYR